MSDVPDQLLMGNEAIARGALEAGISFAAGYPGNPSSEIIETLAKEAKNHRLYVEWSINEKVALEAAAAASFAGLRALATMKQNGVNVASDFITNLTLSGTGAGLVLVTCDDPSGISSTNEQDARFIARLADLPLLEPSSPQEALEMTRFAFDLSEAIHNLVVLRSVSRLSHTRQNCRVGELQREDPRPVVDLNKVFHTFPVMAKHQVMHDKLQRAAEAGAQSPFNRYEGPDRPELMIITCGSGWDYSREAVELLALGERVGVLKLGMTWPLPIGWLRPYLEKAAKALVHRGSGPLPGGRGQGVGGPDRPRNRDQGVLRQSERPYPPLGGADPGPGDRGLNENPRSGLSVPGTGLPGEDFQTDPGNGAAPGIRFLSRLPASGHLLGRQKRPACWTGATASWPGTSAVTPWASGPPVSTRLNPFTPWAPAWDCFPGTVS